MEFYCFFLSKEETFLAFSTFSQPVIDSVCNTNKEKRHIEFHSYEYGDKHISN